MKAIICIILCLALFQVSLSSKTPSYNQVNLKQFAKDTHGQAALAYAIKFISSEGVQVGVLPSTSAWSLETVNFVYEQVLEGTNYQINAQVINKQKSNFLILVLGEL